MDAQLSLFTGPSPVPPRLDPLFFAVLLSEAGQRTVAGFVESIRARRGLTAEMRPVATLHVSLVGIGYRQSLRDEHLEAVIAAGGAARFAPFEIGFDTLMSLGRRANGRAPLALACGEGAEGLTMLAGRIGEELGTRGLARRIKPLLLPHLTLLYDRRFVPRTVLDEPLRVGVDGFALVQSLYGRGRYEVVARWPEGRLPPPRPTPQGGG